MAVISVNFEKVVCGEDLVVYRWDDVTEADSFEEVIINGATVLSIMVEGDFGSGGVIGAEGSNADAGSFFTLQTLSTLSADGISPITETALKIRPVITAGTSVSVTVYLLVRGS